MPHFFPSCISTRDGVLPKWPLAQLPIATSKPQLRHCPKITLTRWQRLNQRVGSRACSVCQPRKRIGFQRRRVEGAPFRCSALRSLQNVGTECSKRKVRLTRTTLLPLEQPLPQAPVREPCPLVGSRWTI